MATTSVENSNVDFGELNADTEFKKRIQDFQGSINDLKQLVDTIVTNDVYDELHPEDKIRYDLFLSFTINSLYWLFLRTQGKDPGQHDLKGEINRCKEYMSKSRKLYERKHVMPRIDQDAAKRFIRSGLYDPNDKTSQDIVSEPPAVGSKRKREDSDVE